MVSKSGFPVLGYEPVIRVMIFPVAILEEFDPNIQTPFFDSKLMGNLTDGSRGREIYKLNIYTCKEGRRPFFSEIVALKKLFALGFVYSRSGSGLSQQYV
jgi:hypothetical protein